MSSVALNNPTGNTTPTPNASSGQITNQADLQTQYTQFLTMLTTEMQNQDPTDPIDTTQFTSQLVGFSQLEQQLQTNSNLQTLISDQQSNSIGGSLGYLGHTVVASGGSGFELDGTDPTTIAYSLPSAGASATMSIMDSTGTVVSTGTVPAKAGINTVSFGGADSSVSDLPPGNYTYSITALDANGNAITPTTYTSGQVTGIDSSSGATVLHLGGLSVPAANVVQVTS